MSYLGTFTEVGTVDTASIVDDAVTADKLANSINAEIAANTAKVTNYNQTKADIEALGIAASSITGALPAISGASLTNLPGGGKVLQVVSAYTTSRTTHSNLAWRDIGLSASITPSSSSSKILIMMSVSMSGGVSQIGGPSLRMKRGSTVLPTGNSTSAYVPAAMFNPSSGRSAYTANTATMCYLDTPSTTSATTYKAEGYGYTIAFAINGPYYTSETSNGGSGISSIVLMEIGV